MPIIQVWTGPRCQSGAEPLGPLAKITSGRVVEATSGAQGPSLSIPRAVADQVALRAGAWLWINHPRRGISEWPILSLTRGDGRARDVVTVQGGTIRQAVALRGTVRTVNRYGSVTTRFDLPALTPSEILRRYFVPNLDADNLAWITLGSIDYTGTIALGTMTQWSRGQLLDAIERATGYRVVFTRLGDAAYQLDLRHPDDLSGDDVLLSPGTTVDSLEVTEDLVSGATVVEPRGSDGEALGETWWSVAAITGSGPFWVRIVDPAGGPPVIREDGQLTGWYLRPNDGLPVEITDSRALDSAVQVASRTGLGVGTLAALWGSVDGALPAEVTAPAGLATRGRVVQSITAAVPSMRGNRITDPALRDALASWERVNPSAGGADVFRRDDPVTVTLRVNGAVAGGGTTVNVDEAPANTTIRFGDALLVEGVTATTNANATTSATGTATVGLAGTLSASIAGDTSLTWRRGDMGIGVAVTNGTQSAGASSLQLKTLTSTPQLAAADTLVRSDSQVFGFGTDGINYSGTTLGSGTSITITESRLIREQRFDSPFPTIRAETVQYTALASADAPPGAGIAYTAINRPPDPSGPDLLDFFVETITGSWIGVVPVSTFTLSGAQPTWNGDARATATISGTVGTVLGVGQLLAWVRAGTVLGTVRLTAPTVSADTTLALELTQGATRILSGDVFAVPSQTLYSATATTLSGTGTGTISLRAATGSGLADNAVITVQRCLDYASSQFGGPLVLRLRGGASAAPSTYLGGSDFGIYSPIFRVESPDPTVANGQFNYRLTIATTGWITQPSQTLAAFFALWDVDTGARLSFGPIISGSGAFTPLFNISNHFDLTSSLGVSLRGSRRLRVSIHPGSNQGSHFGGFVFLRSVSFSVYLGSELATNPTGAQVDGSFANQAWHRSQDILDASRDLSRVRVQLGSAAPTADDPARLLIAGGRVRLRSESLGLDTRYRVARIVWSLTDDDTVEAELATLTPRLTET